jgi:hypothetical protein
MQERQENKGPQNDNELRGKGGGAESTLISTFRQDFTVGGLKKSTPVIESLHHTLIKHREMVIPTASRNRPTPENTL